MLVVVLDKVPLNLAVVTRESHRKVLLVIGFHQNRRHQQLVKLTAHRFPQLLTEFGECKNYNDRVGLEKTAICVGKVVESHQESSFLMSFWLVVMLRQ